MKSILVSILLILATATAFADVESKIANCKLLNDENRQFGSMDIFSSDNGDEGILTFSYTLKGSSSVSIVFKDNVQDDGAEFLTSGKSAIYVSYGGVRVNGGSARNISSAAVYLENKKGVIRGKLKADFQKADLICSKL